MIEIIEQEFRGYKEVEEIMKMQVYGVVDMVKNTDTAKFLDYILDIRRTQALINGKWETLGYEFCVRYGGPNVYLDTEQGIVKGYWGGEKFVIKCSDKDFLEKLEEIKDYLNEIYTT